MKLVSAKCPSCGADIEVDKDSDKTKCEYCDSSIVVEDAIKNVKIEVTGNLEIKNIPKYESYVSLGDRYYGEYLYREARTEYKKALEYDPHNPKLIFREKICRACMASYDNINENLIVEALDDVRDTIEDEKEVSNYVRECVDAMQQLIDKSMDYYLNNNLTVFELEGFKRKISACASKMWNFKKYVHKDDKISLLRIYDYYISALEKLSRSYFYKINHTRKRGIAKPPASVLKEIDKKMIIAEKEREELLAQDESLKAYTTLYRKKKLISDEQWIKIFIIIFVLNIIFGLIFWIIKISPCVFCLFNFIYQLFIIYKYFIKYEKNKYRCILSAVILLFSLGNAITYLFR